MIDTDICIFLLTCSTRKTTVERTTKVESTTTVERDGPKRSNHRSPGYFYLVDKKSVEKENPTRTYGMPPTLF